MFLEVLIMKLEQSIENLKYDTRLIDYNLKHNKVTKEEYQNYLQSLNDSSNDCQAIELETPEVAQPAEALSESIETTQVISEEGYNPIY